MSIFYIRKIGGNYGKKHVNVVIQGPKVAEEIFRKNDVTINLDGM